MEQLRSLAASPEFDQVKGAVLSLNPTLLVDQVVGPHLLALRTGLLGVIGALEKMAAEEAEEAPADDELPEDEAMPEE